MSDNEVIVDLLDGEDPGEVECPVCGRGYEDDWDIGHGCGRCGVGYDHCPTDGCDGTLIKYF